MLKELIIIGGPTGVGKTNYAIKLAQKLNTEIISIDSVQCFKYFDIGSAKPGLEELNAVTQHMINVYEPDIKITAAKYAADVTTIINNLHSLNKIPVLCGGSNLYLKAILYGLADLPSGNETQRTELEKLNNQELHEKLKILDLVSYQKINENDRVRIIRALESAENGEKFSDKIKGHNFSELKYHPTIHLLDLPRDQLYNNINLRTKKMLDSGLIEETRSILEKFGTVAPLNTIGYRQVVQYLNGETEEKTLYESIAQATRRYAKQQLTFWRNEPEKRGWKLEKINS